MQNVLAFFGAHTHNKSIIGHCERRFGASPKEKNGLLGVFSTHFAAESKVSSALDPAPPDAKTHTHIPHAPFTWCLVSLVARPGLRCSRLLLYFLAAHHQEINFGCRARVTLARGCAQRKKVQPFIRALPAAAPRPLSKKRLFASAASARAGEKRSLVEFIRTQFHKDKSNL